ncbi:MAG: response regulator [Deltaproteobacteria bacterium]|nr:response regulator [Deltaproteobacteria bacterium]
MTRRVLLVDDDQAFRERLEDALQREPYTLLTAPSALEALEVLARFEVDVVVSDEKMPHMTGSEFLTLLKGRYPDTIRIILTGHACLDAAIRAVNHGEIYRFFTKPCRFYDLAITIRQAIRQKELQEENRRLLERVRRQQGIIRGLEDRYPGITLIRKDGAGQILLDEEENPASLSEKLGSLLDACREHLAKPG